MCSTRASKAILSGVVLACGLSARVAAAQPVSKDVAMAETLFEEAKHRMETGDYASACPKLAESYRLDPGSGTLTALALCHEQLGKTATAWAEFIEVVTEAQQGGRADREKFARKHVSALEPHLSRLTISVDNATAHMPDVQVKRDHLVVGSAAWGVSSPIDPGDHLIEANAPGHKAWSTRITIAPNGDKQSVAVPELEEQQTDATDQPASDATSAPPMVESTPPATVPDSTPSRGGGQRLGGWVLGGIGAASAITGAVFGLQAISKASDAKSQCAMGTSACPDSAIQENHAAKTDAVVADVMVGVGLAAVVTGIVLVVTAPSAPTAAPPDATTTSHFQVVPTLGPRIAGLSFRTRW